MTSDEPDESCLANGDDMGRRAIGESMRRAKSRDARRATALDWAARWAAYHMQTLHNLEKALQHHDVGRAGQYCGQLKALHEKAFGALPRVIERLAEDDV